MTNLAMTTGTLMVQHLNMDVLFVTKTKKSRHSETCSAIKIRRIWAWNNFNKTCTQ